MKEIPAKNIGGRIKLLWQTYVTSNNELIATWPINGRIVDRNFYKGGNTLKPVGVGQSELEALEPNPIQGDMNPIQKEYLVKILDLARDNNIPITFIETPKYIKTSRYKDYQRAMDLYKQLLISEGIPYIVNCDNDVNTEVTYLYDNGASSNFMDMIHLSYDGRVKFTEALCELMTD